MAGADPGADPVRVHAVETGAVTRKIEVEVGADRVDRAFERAYRQLQRGARVRGFRPGKVPRSVLERIYGATVVEDVERQLVRETLPDALEQAGLEPVAEPEVDAKPPAAGATFRYSADVEVKPEIVIGDIRGLAGRRPRVEVRDEDVDQELEALRQRQSQLIEEPEDTRAAPGHVLTLDYVGRIDGRPFEGGSRKDAEVELGGEHLLPGFEEQLTGARAGDDLEVRVTFPDDHPEESLRGQESVFSVHVAAIKRREVPELDDEFAKDLGEFDTLDDLRARIRSNLDAVRRRSAETALHRSLVDALLERCAFEVPPSLVDRRLERMLEEAHQQLGENLPAEALHAELARWREEWRPQAEREVRRALALDAVTREQGITVEDADVEARLDEIAAQRGTSAARLRRAYRGDLQAALRAQIADERALDLLARNAEIEEVADT